MPDQTQLQRQISALETEPSKASEMWPSFLNTVFYAPLDNIPGASPQHTLAFTQSQNDPKNKTLLISERPNDVAQFSQKLTQVAGGNLVHSIPENVELLIPLGNQSALPFQQKPCNG